MLPANQLLSSIELVSKPKKKSTEIVFFLDYGHLALYNRDSGVILKIKLPRDIPDFTSFYARADLLIEYLKTAKNPHVNFADLYKLGSVQSLQLF